MTDEYIRKADAVMQLSHNKSRGDDEWELAVASDMEIIRKLQPADVAKIVRCKNCQYHSYDDVFCCYWCEHEGMAREVKPDFYCGYGEE